ncbi:glycogen/starch synthase, partial [Bacteroides acidifaciens]
MKAKKILFITQEMTPYVPNSELAALGRELPQEIQDRGMEIRT